MVKRTVVEEIISLGPVRIQKIFGLFGHVVVFEIFSKHHRRLYLVFDTNRSTKTLHVQRERPQGLKTKSSFIALLTKYACSQQVRFFKLDEDASVIKAVFSNSDGDFSIIFEIDSIFKAGLFHEQKLRACFPAQESLPFRAGFLVGDLVATSIDANLARAEEHHRALLTFHHEAIVATERTQLKQELNKKRALYKNVEGDLARCQAALSLEADANLLKTHMHLLKRGMKSAQLVDYTQDPPLQRTIALDEKLTPQAFLTKTFNKIKKAKRGIEIISRRLNEIREDLVELEKRNEAFHEETTPLKTFANFPEQPSAASAKKTTERVPFHVFTSMDGITLWVGKSAKDSDDMLRLVKGNEWFFHVRDAKGAHVIVKWRDDLPVQTLHEAALLAHHFSKNRDTHASIVQYTRAKNVHKKKGLAKGAVLITQEKTIEIIAHPDQLKAILDRKQGLTHEH